jgi:hypothetical protein
LSRIEKRWENAWLLGEVLKTSWKTTSNNQTTNSTDSNCLNPRIPSISIPLQIPRNSTPHLPLFTTTNPPCAFSFLLFHILRRFLAGCWRFSIQIKKAISSRFSPRRNRKKHQQEVKFSGYPAVSLWERKRTVR